MVTVVGTFGSVEEGQRARSRLVHAGIADARIVVSPA
jgi:hypothetical protein